MAGKVFFLLSLFIYCFQVLQRSDADSPDSTGHLEAASVGKPSGRDLHRSWAWPPQQVGVASTASGRGLHSRWA